MKPKDKAYWRKHLVGLQRGLNLLAAAGLPAMEVPKPSEATRRFNSKMERILKSLGIKKRYQNELVSFLHGGVLSVSSSKHQQAQIWLALLKELGVEISPAEMLEVIDAWESMEKFVFHTSRRAFQAFKENLDLKIKVKIEDEEEEDEEEVDFEEAVLEEEG